MTELESKQLDISAAKLGVKPSFLTRYSFPHMFGSTAGARGGIGGAAMTTYTIDAYTDREDVEGRAVLWQGDHLWKVVREFRIQAAWM